MTDQLWISSECVCELARRFRAVTDGASGFTVDGAVVQAMTNRVGPA
jgi:hypothetical protein